MAGNEFNFFQLPTGVDGGSQNEPPFDKKISTYGAYDEGTENAYGFKDEISNPMPRDIDNARIDNPLQEGSTLKRVRDDKFVRMSMGDVSIIENDVNDRDRADADKDVYMPEEGWRSFGGKNDFPDTYQGGQLQG